MKLHLASTALILVSACIAKAGLPEAPPETLGFDPARLARVEGVIRESIEKKQAPGAVVVVGRRGKLAYVAAIGERSIVPTHEPMTRDTVFDLASLTKPVATATSVMILVEQGKLRLDDTVGKLLPEFDNHGKGSITIESLLRHRTGLTADNPFADFLKGPDEAWRNLANLSLAHTPDTYVYSDVGFMILGRIVEKISGEPLDQFARKNVFEPLGMSHTGFLPDQRENLAPTEKDAGVMLRGIVHDPRARALGGVAGHAGLFGTADDLAVYAQTLLDGGVAPNGKRILGPLTVRAMADAGTTPAKERRGLGWDVDTPHSAPRGGLFGTNGFGHTGFTGTSLWIDPPTGVFVVILTSRLHPDGKAPSPTSLRYRVATVVAASIVEEKQTSALNDLARFREGELPGEPSVLSARREPRSPRITQVDLASTPSEVLCGIDVLAREKYASITGKRVGLVTNHTGRTRTGISTIDALHTAPGVNLKALFSPEHGIRGAVDSEVADALDEKTGLPIFSLYGKTRKPSAESLKDIDLLVYDIQDIGARFYTYISTLGLVLEAAKERAIPIYVLDRPNPIGGIAFDGPVRDPSFASFIAHHALPVRHGMTVGELAMLFNKERSIGADLLVIKCEGWKRSDLFDRTGLLWVNPSPNMRSLTEALLYPGVGLLEATNLATGRGTDTPFERVGAPYIDPVRFANELNSIGLHGVRFVPIRFSPKERQFAGKDCGGVYLQITEQDQFEPIGLGVGMAVTLRKLYPSDWKPDGFLKMIADEASYKAVLDGKTPKQVAEVWKTELAEFGRMRDRYLLYR